MVHGTSDEVSSTYTIGTLYMDPVLTRSGSWTLIWTIYASTLPSRTELAPEHLIQMESSHTMRSAKNSKGPAGYEVKILRLDYYKAICESVPLVYTGNSSKINVMNE